MFISFFFDWTGRSRPEEALNPEPLNLWTSEPLNVEPGTLIYSPVGSAVEPLEGEPSFLRKG